MEYPSTGAGKRMTTQVTFQDMLLILSHISQDMGSTWARRSWLEGI